MLHEKKKRPAIKRRLVQGVARLRPQTAGIAPPPPGVQDQRWWKMDGWMKKVHNVCVKYYELNIPHNAGSSFQSQIMMCFVFFFSLVWVLFKWNIQQKHSVMSVSLRHRERERERRREEEKKWNCCSEIDFDLHDVMPWLKTESNHLAGFLFIYSFVLFSFFSL